MTTRLTILVSGAPAAGKSTLAQALAAALGLPLISKDEIKETLVDSLAGLAASSDDLTWSRRMGGAAMEVLWRLAGRCPAVILEANFRPHSDYEQMRLRRLGGRQIEIRCVCPADELTRRFAVRAITAHAAHPLTALSAELLAEFDGPMGVGPTIDVDTSQPVDLVALSTRLRDLIRPPPA
jgi:predicted kinase